MKIRYFADAEGKTPLEPSSLTPGATIYMKVGNGPIMPVVVVAVTPGSD